MKTKSLADILNEETQEYPHVLENNFLHQLAHNRLLVWIFNRLKWPLVTTIYQSFVSYLLWKEVLLYFPLFDWGDIFTYIQIFFAISFLINTSIESLKAEYRKQNQKNERGLELLKERLSFPILLASAIPLIWILCSLFPRSHIGTYDYILLILGSRLLTQTYFRLGLAPIGSFRRLPIQAVQWLLPILCAYLFYHFSDHTPKNLCLALFIEWILSTILQYIRIKKFFPELKLNLFRNISFVPSKYFLILILKRLPAAFPIIVMHVTLSVYFSNLDYMDQEAILFHAFTPILGLWVRSPSYFWKEILLDVASSLQRVLEVLSILGLLIVLGLSENHFYHVLAMLCWCEVRYVHYWLKPEMKAFPLDALVITLLLLKPDLTGSFVPIIIVVTSALYRHLKSARIKNAAEGIELTMRRSFWSSNRSQQGLRELTELGLTFVINQRKIFIFCDQSCLPSILAWGRGWISEHKFTTNDSAPPKLHPTCSFNLFWLFWRRNLPHELNASDKMKVLKSILSGFQSARLAGKVRLSGQTCFWRRSGWEVALSFA